MDTKTQIGRLLEDHFNERRKHVPEVASRYFNSPSEVFKRHWRNRRDAPKDIAAPFVWVWNFTFGRVASLKIKMSDTGKTQELGRIVADDLLALRSLQTNLEEFMKSQIKPYEHLNKLLISEARTIH